jgi:hypothetical protein
MTLSLLDRTEYFLLTATENTLSGAAGGKPGKLTKSDVDKSGDARVKPKRYRGQTLAN